jgi:hypothetical protein
VRVVPSAAVSSTSAPYAIRAVAGVDACTIAERALSKIA